MVSIMITFFITIFVLLFVAIMLMIFVIKYNKFQELLIKSNEAEANIDTLLRKRFDLINKSINVIKANTDIEGEILELIVKLRSRKLSNFELDRQLYEAINEFNLYKEKYPNLMESESFVKINNSLNESENEIIALRKYYNNTITEYNRLVKKFPSNITAILCNFKEKTYYDGKNMNDDIINDFKL